MENLRRLERFTLKLPASIEIVSESEEHDKEILNLLTTNICSGGAFFHTDRPLPEGTSVKIDLVLAIDELKKLEGKQAFIKVNGEVIRAESDGMAICFGSDYTIKSL
jgi:hypothetical protein